jgi:glycerophosphoryl diester phosphodiesterase
MASSIHKPSNLPQCWGHRGASAAYPENTLASFEAAMKDGAEGIESDVHVSSDNVVVMFHDPYLHRTTDYKGNIRDLEWYGEKGMMHARTTKEPKQGIPTFEETINLLMRPENHHVKFNVDVKVQNDPDRLFKLLHEIITAQPEWETALAPRILLGLWHPKFIAPAKQWLPFISLSHIGGSIDFARTYFWSSCESFSLEFACLCTPEGQKFTKECQKAGKKVMVWTVNKKEEMIEAVSWGVDAILTDVTKVWLDLRAALAADFENVSKATRSRLFLWTSLNYYSPVQRVKWSAVHYTLQREAGPFPPRPITVS